MTFEEKTISSEMIYEGKILNLRRDLVEVKDGGTSYREIIEHSGGVAVAAVTDDNQMILVRQYRKAAEQDILEIPAGRREDQEDPLVAAMRELREETGYTARKFSHLTSFYATIGYCTEVIHVYLATGLTPGETDFDEHEAIEMETYPIDELKQMIFDGEIVDGKTITAILLAAEKLGLSKLPGSMRSKEGSAVEQRKDNRGLVLRTGSFFCDARCGRSARG